jgi:subtilisin-like proprotein convertase family protein
MIKQKFDGLRALALTLVLGALFLSPVAFGAEGVSTPPAAPSKPSQMAGKTESEKDHFMVPRAMLSQLPSQSELVHSYRDRSLVRVPVGALSPQLHAASSELEDHDSLGYRAWHGSLEGHDPARLADFSNGYALLGLVGPMDPAWKAAIERFRLVIVDHATPYGLLVRGDSSSVAAAAAAITTSEGFRVIRHALPLPDQARISPRIGEWLSGQAAARDLGVRIQGGEAVVRVVFHADADIPGVQRRVNAILNRGPEFQAGKRTGQYLASPAGISRVLDSIPAVAFVHGEYPRTPFNNLAAKDYITNVEPVWNDPGLGYTGAGIIAGVNDSGMDQSHPDFPAGSVVAFLGAATNTDNAHGTHVTGTVAGRGAAPSPTNTSSCGDQTTPLPDARGIAWNASIAHNNIFDGGSATETDMMQWHAQQGSDLTNNSWGYGSNYDYFSQSADIDAAVRDADPSTSISDQMSIIFAAGNDGPGSGTIGAPGNAKNAITVGASQSDRCGSYIPSQCSGPNINNMACFSGRGPAQQRIKPDVVAPGTDILSTDSGDPQASNPWDQSWTGSEYAIMPGTSMASPVVTGAAAVFMEAHLDRHGQMPSPALVKAALINTATDMGFGFPSMDQGWGRINLRKAIEGPVADGIQYLDQDAVDHLSTGESWTTTVSVQSSSEPFRVTMVWTDPPGTGGCDPCHVNDLDLIVTAPDGTIYRGNQFTGAWSAPNPAGRDAINNVENAFVDSPMTGQWQIEVTSVSTAQNPQNLSGQDFAVVMTGELGGNGIQVDPAGVSLCTTQGSQDFTLTLSDQFGGTTDLSVSGLPAGASGSFSDDPVVFPDVDSVYTLSSLGSAASGSYTLNFTATDSGDPGNTAETSAALALFAGAPGAPGLQLPANGATGVSVPPVLEWSASADADDYFLEIATDSGFSTVVHSATVAGTSYEVPVTLNGGTTYYWRVSANNQCGAGSNSSTFSFTTASVLNVCSTPALGIPDDSAAGVSDSLSVAQTADITDLNLYLRGSHTWVGDLGFELTHPDGSTQVLAVDRPGMAGSGFGCDGDDFDLWLDDEGTDGAVENQCAGTVPALFGNATPNAAFSAFDGLAADGTWTLTAADNEGGDTGSLAEWCLEITFEVVGPHTVTASVGSGSGNVSPASQQVNDGDTTTVSVFPDAGWHIDTVSGCGGSLAGNTYTTGAITADCAVTADFAIDTYTLTYTAGAGGSISGSSPQTVDHGSDGTAVEAIPATGYSFVQWSDGSTANPRTDTSVTGDINVEAQFAINSYTLTYTAGTGGSINGTSPQTVDHGSDGTAVEALPDTGYSFVQWSDGSTANPRADTNVTGDISVEAQFALNSYTVSGVVGGGNGSVSPTSQSVGHGSAASLTITPDTGWSIDSVSGCGGSLSGNTYTTAAITGDCTVTAGFVVNTYTVTFVDFDGTVLDTQTVDHGEAATAPADPVRPNYIFTGWDVTFDNVTGDLTVTAQYVAGEDDIFSDLFEATVP